MKSLRDKIYDVFDVYIPEGSSNKAVLRELDRRGKFDLKKLMQCVFLLLDEVEIIQKKKK